jgi:hypothetical protein
MKKMAYQGASAVILGQKIIEKDDLPPLARDDKANKLDLIDRIVFNPPVLWCVKNIAKFCENRLEAHCIYEYLLLHYRIAGRRKFLKEQHV